MSDTDLELLARYTRQHAEDAFAELVRRHLGLVYSAAWRQVRSPQLAEEVTQSTFLKLARQAGSLEPDTILTAWLYQVTRRAAIDVVRREASRQLREQIATELNAMNATPADWTHIEPLLDEAMHALDDTDRTAVLLRYFENKSLREVGATLGTSENAAQKRLGRAIECLREFFTKRGVTVSASGLVVVISAHAIQATPAGLSVLVLTATAAVTTTIATTTTATATKAIAMTTLQKVVFAATLAAVGGAGIYEARQAARWREQNQALQKQQAPLAEQIQQMSRDRDEAAHQLAALRDENERLNRNTSELLRLRGEASSPRRAQDAAGTPANPGAPPGPTAMNQAKAAAAEFGRELGLAVVRGDPGALDKVAELSRSALKSFNTNGASMNDTQRGELAVRTFTSIQAAFEVIGEAAVNGNPVAISAVERALQITELKGRAVKIVGTLAGNGNEAALEILVNADNYGILLSSSVFALRPAAEAGNAKAIDALAAVTKDAKKQALWYEVAKSLAPAAESGNAVAVDGLVAMSVATNKSVRDAVVFGLKRASANQNAKATETLRSMGVQ